MLGQSWEQLRHAIRRIVGQLLSRVHLHRIEHVTVDGVPLITKRRRWFAEWLIPAGNHFLRQAGDEVEALGTADWLRWEQVVEAATQRGVVLRIQSTTGRGRKLICRRITGVTLKQVLLDGRFSQAQKGAAVRWAMSALLALQRVEADWTDCLRQPITHGDATTFNVIIDLEAETAYWIDFDTRHLPTRSLADRVTDDLRALIFSAAVNWPTADFMDLAQILITSGIERNHLRHFRQRMNHAGTAMTTFELAQAPLGWSTARQLRTALLQHLESV